MKPKCELKVTSDGLSLKRLIEIEDIAEAREEREKKEAAERLRLRENEEIFPLTVDRFISSFHKKHLFS